jgi:hypothetical protein
MKSTLVFYRKNILKNGDMVEMKIWQVPHSKVKPHGLKYSLVYIRKGERIVGYDNAEGKGDHKHSWGNEIPYNFKDMDALISDFYSDIEGLMEG